MRNKIWLFGILATTALTWILFSQDRQYTRQEKIKFSHKFHQEEVGTACNDCHVQTPQSTQASDNLLPVMADCAGCHDIESEDNCTLCHYENEDTWLPFEVKEPDIIFSHKFHLEQTGSTCETCHSNLSQVDFANAESMPDMASCSSCHNNEQATLECMSCHTNTLTLRPADHTSDFLVTHKNMARIGQEDCAVCHTDDDCAQCHEGGSSLLFTTSGANTDVQSPFNISISTGGTRSLVLPRVHELNFRFTHPLQAEGRSQECAVCHDTRNFCQDCHESEGVDVAGKPIWHGGPDWGAVAGVVGSSGGRHAQLAKQDIENCAGCHSTQGDDPTCLLCHTDFDGLRGTNPKTHETGFANQFSAGSDFHDDESALCYSCHTNTMQAGAGFCGYCHGPR